MRILLISLAIFISSKSYAQRNICNEFTNFEKQVSSNLPKKVDEITEIVELSVNCETKVSKYTKRILVDVNLFKAGWKKRKQRQHTNLNCNKRGLASTLKWTAMDVFLDKDFNYLVTLITTPNDCQSN